MTRLRVLAIPALVTGLLLPGPAAQAQSIVNISNPGARAAAMGGAFIGVADDATTAVTNPAGLSNLSLPEVYGEVKGSRALSSPFLSFLSVAIPVNPRLTVAVVRNQNLHDVDIDESLYAAAAGAQLSSHLRVGLSVGLLQATYTGFSSAYGVRVTGGIQYQAMEKLTIGLTGAGVKSISRAFGVLDDSRVGGGLSYAALPQLLISADVVRYLASGWGFFHNGVAAGGGAEYVLFGMFGRPNDRIFLRGGGCTCNPFYNGASGTIGIGYATQRRFQTDIAFVTGLRELTLSAVYRY